VSRLAKVFLVAAALFALTHGFATHFNLYWFYPWFDVLMHFWGGVLITAGTVVLARQRLLPRPIKKRLLLTIAFICIFGWEVFEYVFGISAGPLYILDTISDVAIGFTGVLTGYLALRKTNRQL
jgi:hypothetical protein